MTDTTVPDGCHSGPRPLLGCRRRGDDVDNCDDVSLRRDAGYRAIEAGHHDAGFALLEHAARDEQAHLRSHDLTRGPR